MRTRLIVGGALVALFAGAATALALQADNTAEPAEIAADEAGGAARPSSGAVEEITPGGGDGGVETVADAGAAASPTDAGLTPMPQREAVVGLLNKRNGLSRDLTLKPGQAVRIGDAVVRLSACERTAPWEQEQLTGAFVQLEVRGADAQWRRAFSGWLYKERPHYNVVVHPIYDVWPKSCTMSFPATGPGTTVLSSGDERGSRSSAPKAGRRSSRSEPPSSTPAAEDSAPSSNAI